MPFRRIALAFLSAFLMLLCVQSAQAQLTTDPTLERGMKPYGTFEGGAIDSVSMTNGDLNLHIPLVSYPQRGGKLHFGFYLKYDNNSYVHIPQGAAGCNVTRPPNCEYGDTVLGPELEIVSEFNFKASVSGIIPPTSGPYASITTNDGSSHEVGATSNGWRTIDASGYLCVSNCATVIDRDGIRYTSFTSSHVPLKIEDPNGNFLSGATNANGVLTTLTDTMGRSVTIAPSFGGLSGFTYTTDLSGCTGTLATTTAYLWNIPGYQGAPMTYKFCYAKVYYGGQDCIEANGTIKCSIVDSSSQLIQSIVLPNNTTWTFQYDSDNPSNPTGKTGNLLQIIFPTGGYIKYTWKPIYICQPLPGSTHTTTYTFAVASRTLNSNDGTGEHSWGYTFNSVSNNPTSYTTSSLDPLSQQSVHIMSALGGVSTSCSFYETQVQSLDSASNVLKTVNTDYHADWDPLQPSPVTNTSNVVPIRVTTTWPSGQVSKVETDYDSGVAMTGNQSGHTLLYGLPVAKREYDYGTGAAGALIRTTTTAYQSLSNSNYLTNNLLALPSSVVTKDGSGTTKATTNYLYDQSSVVSSGVTIQHDSTSPDGTYRGNANTVQRWVNLPSSTYLNTTTTFYDTGTAQQITDPAGHSTTFAYSSTFDGAYPTTITNALNQPVTKNYDFNTGLLTSSTDLNSLITSYSYDNMWRLASVTGPDGGTSAITHQESSFPFTTTVNKPINTSQTETTVNVFDGLGRVTQTQLQSDPQGIVYTDTAYDALGRVATVSNPHRSGTDVTTTTGTTTFGYDALSRKTSETYPDNSVLTTAYCGPSTLVTDPTGRWRRSRTDGLGRLVEVDEPNSTTATVASTGCPGSGEPIWITSYGYDTLGNLTSVLQNGSHSRSFSYDSISRLLTSANPEVGTITYAYNTDGTIHTKQDARLITTTYLYDALLRETSASYSNGDPSTTTVYDGTNCLGLATCQNVGHRTSMTDAGGSEIWAYQVDATNHRSLHKDQRTTNGITKSTTYFLDLVGNTTQATYPTGRVVNYTFDSANRPSTATDGSNGITYATGFKTSPGSTCLVNVTCYTPQGTLYALSIGQSSSFTNGLNLTDIYNNRLQPLEFKATSAGGNAIDITYSFLDPLNGNKNAGHVFGITNNLDTTRSQTFTYDQLSRITGAQTTSTHATSPTHCWGETYSLDAWANLQSIAATTNSAYTGCSQEAGFSQTADTNNHLSGFGYDVSGNTSGDGVNAYAWDGESQLKSAAGVNYLYDGDGRRVYKSSGKLYWYGTGGEILAETDASGNTTAEYIFFGGKRITSIAATTSLHYS